MTELVLKFWCRHFHKSVMRPVHGKYTCATCLRAWPVPWGHSDDPRMVSSQQLDVYTDVITPAADAIGVAPSHGRFGPVAHIMGLSAGGRSTPGL